MTRLVPPKPMLRPPTPRRAVHATLLAALVFLLGDVALGFAIAGEETAGAEQRLPMPEVFGTAAPATGDAGTYTTTRYQITSDGHEALPGSFQPFEWHWTGDGEGLDGEGSPVRYHAAELWDGRTILFDAHAHRAFAEWRIHEGEETSETTTGTGSLPATSVSGHRSEDLLFIDPQSEHPYVPCGLYHGLQGTTMSTNGSVTLLRECHLPGRPFKHMGPYPDFQPVRAERLGEHETVVFHLDDAPPPFRHDTSSDDTYSVTVWLTEGIPYPLRIESAHHQADRTEVHAMELDAFVRGTGALDTAAPTASAAPPLAFAPVRPWGIDDTGVDHPFPISVAYQKALDHPDYPDLREFMDAHPDAVTSNAAYVSYEDDEAITHHWTITVADTAGHHEFCSYQQEPKDHPLSPTAVAKHLPGASTRHTAETCDWVGASHDPAQMPAVLPTAASLLARAQAYLDAFGIAGTANAYDLFTCAECDMAPPIVYAGLTRFATTEHVDGELPFMSRDQTWEQADIMVQDGNTSGFVSSTQRDEDRFDQPAPPDPEPTTSAPTLQNIGATPIAQWNMPEAPALVGMGAVALGAGLLYYLAPLGKGFVAGLFSRVQPAKAYDHPQRRRIEALLRAEPGLHLAQIARLLGLSRRAARHHLGQLETAGLVTCRKGRGYTCYFLDGSTDRRLMAAAPLLKSDGARAVLAAIVTGPERSLSEVAHITGLSAPTVHHHVGRLKEAGLVESGRDGRIIRHRPTEAGRLALG